MYEINIVLNYSRISEALLNFFSCSLYVLETIKRRYINEHYEKVEITMVKS
jgi:hypothetical protein